MPQRIFAGLLCLSILAGCQPAQPLPTSTTASSPAESEAIGSPETTATPEAAAMSIVKSSFGTTPDGTAVDLYTCTNANGLVLKMTNYGAIVVALETPDRDGNLANINAGYDAVEDYIKGSPYFGATVGRYCNRIANGRFTLDGQEYTLATNNGENHLHGGTVGFDKVVWEATSVETADGVGVKFHRVSPAGEEGYPGNLDVTVVYTLTNQNELKVEFTANTDQPTVLNLTNHNYWNLRGIGSGNHYDHEVQIEADKYLAVDDGLIPTGELADVAGTPLDFRTPRPIGERIHQIDADPVGYDHCYALRNQDGTLTLAAKVRDPASGRVMEIFTTQPGIQFYTGNFLDGAPTNGGLKQHEAFCLETQHYPDSPNQPAFPATVLRPGETYSQTTVHKFSVE